MKLYLSVKYVPPLCRRRLRNRTAEGVIMWLMRLLAGRGVGSPLTRGPLPAGHVPTRSHVTGACRVHPRVQREERQDDQGQDASGPQDMRPHF